MSLLPRQQEAKIVSFFGFQPTWKTSSLLHTYSNPFQKLKNSNAIGINVESIRGEVLLVTIKGVKSSINLAQIK